MRYDASDQQRQVGAAPAEGPDGGHHARPPALRRGAHGCQEDGPRRAPARGDEDASRIRFKAGQRQVTDGPFTETKEVLGGFYLIELRLKAEAIEWAKKIPLGEGGTIEIRPVWPM